MGKKSATKKPGNKGYDVIIEGRDFRVTPRSDGRWQTYYHELGPDGKPDKSRRHCLCGARGEDYKEVARRAYEKECPPEMTFGKAALEWQAVKWKDISRNSVGAYSAPLRRAIEQFGDLPLSGVSASDVTAFLAELGAMEYAKSSVAIHKNVVSMVFEYAITCGWTERNPAERAVMPRNLPKRKREPPAPEAVAAVEHGLNAPFGLFPFLLRFSGLRRGEALALRWSDIDRKKRVIHVTKTIEYAGNGPYLKDCPKTDAGIRDVPLIPVLADAIPLGIGDSYIFHEDGAPDKPLRYHVFRKLLNRYFDAIGHRFELHQLRHAYATLLYDMGVGLKEAQRWLGHASITMTMDVYTHISSERAEDAFAKLSGYSIPVTDGNFDGKAAGNG